MLITYSSPTTLHNICTVVTAVQIGRRPRHTGLLVIMEGSNGYPSCTGMGPLGPPSISGVVPIPQKSQPPTHHKAIKSSGNTDATRPAGSRVGTCEASLLLGSR